MSMRFWNPVALALMVAVAVAGLARAQEEELPKAKAKAKAAKPAAAKAPRPAGKGPLEKPGEKAEIVPAEDPAVTAVLATQPTTPADCFRAAQALMRLDRPELARGFLGKILAAKLDDQQLADLVEQYQGPAFTELASRPELLPEAEQLAQSALGAANRRRQDPKRIEQYIGQLQDPSAEKRLAALIGLKEAHGAAVAALIGVLADPQRAAEHPLAKAALVEMRAEAVAPLADILEHAEPQLAVEAIDALARMKAATATVYLLAPALDERGDPRVRAAATAALARLLGSLPSRSQAAAQLYQAARDYFRGKQTIPTDLDGRVTVWHWDGAAKRCVSGSEPVEAALRVICARLARDALALAPDDRTAQVLALATALEQAVWQSGLDRPLDFAAPAVREALARRPIMIDAVLAYCLEQGHAAGARAAAEILGRIGSAQECLRQGADAAPLVQAVRSPDRRVRLAALEAIVRLQPDAPFAGSSYVPEALAFLAATNGSRRALLANPGAESLQEWLGPLAALHIQADTVASGREAVRQAISCPDYELALVEAGIQNPGVEAVVQQIRQDYRSATLRVGVVARSGWFDRAERLAREDPRTLAFARPHTPESVQWQMKQLSAVAPLEFVGYQERQQQAVRALACLATLASSSGGLYDLRPMEQAITKALYVPRLGAGVAAVLANVGTRGSQVALVDLASRRTQALDVRKAAAKAFLVSVNKHGLLLPDADIRRQYERYNQSGSQDLNTQHLLGTILDTIETRTGVASTVRTARETAKSAKPGEKPAPPTAPKPDKERKQP